MEAEGGIVSFIHDTGIGINNLILILLRVAHVIGHMANSDFI